MSSRSMVAMSLAALAFGTPVAGPRYGDSGAVDAEASASQRGGWRVPVPVGTRVVELPAVPIADRVGKFVRMQPDLVIGGDLSDSNALFYRPSDVAVDSSGSMYLSDTGTKPSQPRAPAVG